MVRQTVTLKLPFLRLNAAKATEFARLQDLNTEVANGILALSPAERSDLPTAHFTNVEIGSAWMNQTIRNARARTKVKWFKVLRVADMGKYENPSRFSCSRGGVNV